MSVPDTNSRMLEAMRAVCAMWAELSNFVAADKPGTVVIKDGDTIIKTITLSYDGSNNLTFIVRS